MNYTKDEHGSIIDPPILPEYEAKINAAALTGNDRTIRRVQAEYDQARQDEAQRQQEDAEAEAREQRDQQDQQRRQDDEARQRQDAANQPQAQAGGGFLGLGGR